MSEKERRGPAESGDHGHGRDPDDRDPGAHVDYYKGGDFPRDRIGPEGGFEERDDFRRSERQADQGQSVPAEADRDDEPR